MYSGPLFIVGMPRSGTKLLRALVNGHSRIGIPDVETEFLPYLVLLSGRLGDLSKPEVFHRFYRYITKLPYFIYRNDSGSLVSETEWFASCKTFSPEGVFEALLRLETGSGWETERIWGDKSPSYIRHLILIKKLYPTAKIIHIVRDVRDYCLSINQAWGKDMSRAAARWNKGVLHARTSASAFPEDYLEVQYENLIKNPEVTLRSICQFLDLPYEDKMLKLDQPTENLGETRGKTGVMTANTDKHFAKMDAGIRARVEALAFDGMTAYGYSFTGTRVASKLGRMHRLQGLIRDGIALTRFQIRKRGLLGAIRFRVGYFIVTRSV